MAPDSHGFIWMPEDGFRKAVAHKASAEQTATRAAVQRPMALKCIQEVTPPPTWKTKPTWYLLAEEDRMIKSTTQRFMAERMRSMDGGVGLTGAGQSTSVCAVNEDMSEHCCSVVAALFPERSR